MENDQSIKKHYGLIELNLFVTVASLSGSSRTSHKFKNMLKDYFSFRMIRTRILKIWTNAITVSYLF